jgi:hypothetical protein
VSSLKGPGKDEQEPTTQLIYIKIPAPIEPLERAERFEDPLEEVLERTGVGEISGGGSLLSAPDADGRRTIEYCGIDVDVTDLAAGLELLRTEMRRLEAPAGTSLEFQVDGVWQHLNIYDVPQ